MTKATSWRPATTKVRERWPSGSRYRQRPTLAKSRPYTSAANDTNEISDYRKGRHYDHELRHGERASPSDSLIWAVLDRHRERMARNGPDEEVASSK